MSVPSPAPAAALAQLTHNRWALPVLAQVARDGGCKMVTLSRRLGASPASLRRALERLGQLGLVIRNPGYGHPLRPEYILGPVGELTAGLPREILAWSDTVAAPEQLLMKWQLPVLVALEPDVQRFGELRRSLTSASPRAVTLALKSHSALGLVQRDVEDGYPPSPLYSVTAAGIGGREPAQALARILVSAAG